jgi:hypothetical protein
LRFVLNGQTLATLEAPPFEVWWQLQAGDYELQVLGLDEGGNEYRSELVGFRVTQ